MVVAEVDSPERWAFGLKVGAQVGLTDTASGYVLLAFQDGAGRRSMIASHQEVEGELDVNQTQLLKVVRNVAKKGYADSRPSQNDPKRKSAGAESRRSSLTSGV